MLIQQAKNENTAPVAKEVDDYDITDTYDYLDFYANSMYEDSPEMMPEGSNGGSFDGVAVRNKRSVVGDVEVPTKVCNFSSHEFTTDLFTHVSQLVWTKLDASGNVNPPQVCNILVPWSL